MTLLSSGCARPQLAGFSLDGTNAVAIRTDWLRAQDLFVIAQQFNRDGSVDVKVVVNPLVDMIWLAGAVFLLGSLVAMWPYAREKRRHARRTVELGTAGAWLVERRDRALAALRELEFDHRTGKIGDDGYAALLGPLRAEAAEALRAVEAPA